MDQDFSFNYLSHIVILVLQKDKNENIYFGLINYSACKHLNSLYFNTNRLALHQ